METLSSKEEFGKNKIREEVTQAFQNRGITIDHLTDAVIEEWALDDHTREQIKDSIQRVFTDKKLHSSVLWGLAFDQLAQEGKLRSPLVSQLVNGDDSLCNVDEIIAKIPLQSDRNAIDRFSLLDRTKANSLPKNLDEKRNLITKDPQTNMMADDLVITVLVMTEMDLFNRGILREGQLSQSLRSPVSQSRKKHKPDSRRPSISDVNKDLIEVLQEAGITQDHISSKAYELQAPFNPGLTLNYVNNQTKKMLKSNSPQQRERAYNLMFALETYRLIKNPEILPEPLREYVKSPNEEILEPFRELIDSTSYLVSDIARGQLGYLRSRSGNDPIQEITNVLSANAAAIIASHKRERTMRMAKFKDHIKRRVPDLRGTLGRARNATGKTFKAFSNLANRGLHHDHTMDAK